MRLRVVSFIMLVALLSAFAIAPLGALAKSSLNVPISVAPVTNTAGAAVGTLTGNLTVTSFTNQGGRLLANGTLSGTITNSSGAVVQTLTNAPVQVPVAQASGTCSVLTLDLGPLHLNLLGLVVDLSAVHLNITAQQGSGNLLGNLLCAVSHILDGGAPLGAIAGLLNQILAAL